MSDFDMHLIAFCLAMLVWGRAAYALGYDSGGGNDPGEKVGPQSSVQVDLERV